MAKIYNLFSTNEAPPATFSLSKAHDALPLVRKYTEEAISRSEVLLNRLQSVSRTDPNFKALQKQYDDVLIRWAERIHRLGGVAKGLWLVDFDTGRGYLCWSYPETIINHFHAYDEGFRTRRKFKNEGDLTTIQNRKRAAKDSKKEKQPQPPVAN